MSFDLGRALEDLADAGASRRAADDDALSARVGLMARRIRRRRALRQTGTTAVAACAVGALALGVSYLPGVLGDGRSGPAVSPSPDPVPSPDVTIESLGPEQVCGVSMSDLEDRRQLWHYSESPEREGPKTDDAGFAEVTGATEDVNGAAVDLEYYLPSGAELNELGWTVLVVDGDGVVVGALETGVGPAVSPPGATSTGTTTTLPTTSCADDEALVGTFDVVGVAEGYGMRDGTPYFERATSVPFPVELGGSEPEAENPAGEVFACWQPAPESIHTLPDAGGLTLAVDLPEGPWDVLAEIDATVGSSDGRSIIANVSQGASFALVDDSGEVVAFALAHAPDGVALVSVGPDATATLTTTTYLTGCGPDGLSTAANAEEGLEGTFTAWPFVTAVLKEVTDAEGNATTPSSDAVIVVANPQQVTFTKD